jgi:uncharacterized protein YndB with AHSA1/START domain
MKTIHHVVDIGAPRGEVWRAITTTAGLASWWSTVVRAPSGVDVGGVVQFTFAGDFNPQMQIAAMDDSAVLVWRCIGGHAPWADNTFRFELVDHDQGTRLRFWQEYATELDDDSYGSHNFNWAYSLESLRLRCVAGEGKPFQATVLSAGAAG